MNPMGEWLILEPRPEAILMRVALSGEKPLSFTLTLREALDLGEQLVKLVREAAQHGSHIGEPVG